MPVIGFLHPSSPDAYRVRVFRHGLKDVGFVEGENEAIEYRWADNQIDRLPELAVELVQRRVAMIAAGGPAASFAAKAATTTIPIVFIVGEDRVRLGLVTSLARPGGNLTGINFFSIELAAKRLELLRELVPGATRITVLVNPADATNTESALRGVEPAARSMGLQIQVLNASTIREIDAAFATLVSERPDALFVRRKCHQVRREFPSVKSQGTTYLRYCTCIQGRCLDEKPIGNRLCHRFDDAYVALGGVAQHLQCGLITGAIVGGDGLLHAVEFDDENALKHAIFVNLTRIAAGEQAAASTGHCWSRELGIFGKGVRIGNRTVGRNKIGFGHCSPPFSLDVLSALCV